MLLSLAELVDTPVMSLQTGTEIAYTLEPIINPANLDILAYQLDGDSLDTKPAFLRVQDIRELSDVGFIIDSSDELLTPDDIVNHAVLYTHPLKLKGMPVVDENGMQLGKVETAIMETKTFRVEQLHVKQPLFKRFMETNLLINRAQIKDVSDDSIVVYSADMKDAHEESSASRRVPNPFRGATPPQPESAKIDRS